MPTEGAVSSSPSQRKPGPPEHWEAIPGWTPVWVGLTRLRRALIVRLVVIVLATIAGALAASHGPPPFLKMTLVARPATLIATSGVIWLGLATFSRGPALTQSRPYARAAVGVFTVLLLLELVHLVMAVLAIRGADMGGDVSLLNTLDLVGHLVVLIGIGLFLLSLRQVAKFIGATPDLIAIRHLLFATAALFVAIVSARGVWGVLARTGETVVAFVAGILLLGAAFLIGGVVQAATNIRDDVHLTTAEFAAVTVGDD